ncbi:PREDICTED: dual specificity protein phosphatase 22-B-like isoform X1 [Cyprinodon variegatus]|uniref:Dual specificity protein phosphatase 22-B-like n=2 Tax=Cyprinodon variegatus TaxID=28743 RepID=A0A3Q2EDS1_CYPVA|nr:PREDICTED: dual specificity protein phosphatase 22-B-like isoform X1 [Cyprinodon variegatus]
MGNGINKILPDLYLGNVKDARDRDLLARHNITHILSIHDTAAPVLEDMTYLCISAADHSKQNLIQYFRESIIFIHESRLKGQGCLVHCVAGVSRSVTLVVAYIMTVTGRGWVESLAAIRAARPCAGPNLGFLRQLEEFENTELAEYRAWWMEQYGKNSFNDEEEVQNLLNKKSNSSLSSSSSSSASANIPQALGTGHT